ncbi:MAG: GAF domain-containing protein [Chloroflexota bacterium]
MATPIKTQRAGRATPSEPPASEAPAERFVPGQDPDGGRGDVHDLLKAAVDEAARLLDADGAMVYLLDPATNHLRFAHDAGIRSPRSREWVRSIDLPVGMGMFGRAVAERAVVVTGHYLDDASFDHAEEPDRVVRDLGIHSMVVAPLSAGDDVFGALGTFSARRDAFTPAQIALVRALADHAGAAMRNVRLIEALDNSRRQLADRADVERSLREIAARISAATDLAAVLQLGVDEAARLLHADGARIDLIDPKSGLLRWAYASGAVRPDDSIWPDDPDETLDQGVSGQAVTRGKPFWTGDYPNDRRFPHGQGADTYIEATQVRSALAAPLTGEAGPFGALTVFTARPDAWHDADAALLEAIADQAAIMIRTTRLIEQLDASREALARRADAEQALREIAARITILREPAEILQDVVEQAGRLVRADGVILDLLDLATGNLHWALDDGVLGQQFTPEERAQLWISVGEGATGIAVAEDRVVVADDDLVAQFPPSPESTAFYDRTGFRSMIAAPITGESGPLGVIEVYSKRPAAFSESDGGLVGALASQAAIAITNARLIEELDRSRAELARTADSERTLREIAARVSAILDPAEVLQRIVDETTRLLESDGARIDLYDPSIDALRWAYAAGDAMKVAPDWAASGGLRPGQAVAGTAFAAQRPVRTDDFLEDDRFRHDDAVLAFVRSTGIRSVVAVPLAGDGLPLGTLSVVSRRAAAYDDADADVLAALATQASIAIRNARLIAELERSQAAVARRADTERALRDITARIAALREPDVILRRVVEEAKRLLGTDGAHLTRMSETGTFLVPVEVAGAEEGVDQSWLLSMEFPLGGGINGLAAEAGAPVWTSDYLVDPRIPHELDDVTVAERLGLRGMAAAPLRAPGGEVIGTLAVSAAQPREFADEELDLLQGLADQAAIAITNSTLLGRLTESETRYRYLVERAPDLVWSIGADARLTFLSDAVVRLTGRQPDELIGQHFGALVHESSHDVAEFDWTTGMEHGSQEVRGRVNLAGADGQPVPAEFIATARLDENGRFLGANGSVRDMREQERLEVELRESEIRYRTLASSSPDLVFATDADGRYTFVSDQADRMLGWDKETAIGRHFMEYVAPGWEAAAAASYQALVDRPERVHSSRIDFVNGAGEPVPLEINVVGSMSDGHLTAIHGVARDISDRERLERELRESEGRYRFLVENSPDVVFATDAEGRFTFMSDAIERMAGWRPDEVVGEHYSMIVDSSSRDDSTSRWMALVREPSVEQIAIQNLKQPDGSRVPVEISAIGIVDGDGAFAGIHGSTRDISERARLERELRRQAGELAAGEERAHLARELHDSVTQALFSMTLVSRSVEMLLDRDVAAARAQLTGLRDLQREALAEMRALIFELRPGNLEQDGLTRALRTHTAALQGRIGLPVVVESTLGERLPLAIEEVLYRIAQEALHNIVKHAGARQVRVDIGRTGQGVRLRIEDDGKGFDPATVPDGHLGLAGMRVRADKIGALFGCRSEPGKGTTIEVVVPEAALDRAGVASDPADSSAIRDE